eukprot:SAG31_NODE_1540_length_7954_cov_3.521961_2_plen_204_part_00
MPNGPTEVLKNSVWLGPAPVNARGESWDDSDGSHLAVLRAAGITHIVNCTPDFPFPTAEQLGLGSDGMAATVRGCYFLVFAQLFEKYGTLIERNTALIEKGSPCRARFEWQCPTRTAQLAHWMGIWGLRQGLWKRRSLREARCTSTARLESRARQLSCWRTGLRARGGPAGRHAGTQARTHACVASLDKKSFISLIVGTKTRK